MTTSSTKRFVLSVRGMTCRSCELLLERKILAKKGVLSADADYAKNEVVVTVQSKATIRKTDLEETIRESGYALRKDAKTPRESAGNHWVEIGGSLIVLFALWQVLQAFDIASFAPSTNGALTLGGVLLIGLVAGSSSCLATTGGLLLAMSATSSRLQSDASTRWMSSLYFNTGRLASYYVFGGVIGLLGKGLVLSTAVTGYLSIAVAFLMIPMGLSLMGIAPAVSFLRLPKSMTRRIAALTDSKHPAAPALLGAGTFFLPCGFTQSLQLVALSSGSFASGASLMAVFALGTLPSLLGIGYLSAFTKGTFSRLFMRFAGTLVVILALSNARSGFALTGVQMGFAGSAPNAPTAEVKSGVQEVFTSVTRYGYTPDTMTIRAGIPVRWTLDGSGVSGCTSIMTIPALGISKPLQMGNNVIEFTADRKGPLLFTCSMGMVRGTFNVI